MNKAKSGSIALETLLSLTLCLATAMGVTTLCFVFFAKQLQQVELYFLARSRLYGNTKECRSSAQLWPRFLSLDHKTKCLEDGKVSGELFIFQKSILKSEFNLRGDTL